MGVTMTGAVLGIGVHARGGRGGVVLSTSYVKFVSMVRSASRGSYADHVASAGSYQGGSGFLRWWPKIMVVCSLSLLATGWSPSPIQFATLFAVVAYVHGRWLPWQFIIHDDGVTLTFPFGRHLFLPKQSLTVRMEVVGAIALIGRRREFGYLLMDRILYEPGRDIFLRSAFLGLGYTLK